MNDKTINPPAHADLPLVTVLVGCYNHAQYVIESLESIRLQTYPDIQLIIWDDLSTDNTVEVVRDWIQQHKMDCTFLVHTVNLGLCQSLNKALALSRGKYIAMVSADDICLPEKIARQTRIMENSPADVGVVYSDAFQIDEHGDPLPGMFIQTYRKFAVPAEGFLFDVLFDGNFIPVMTALIRRECYEVVGNYDEDLCFEDWDMWLRISRKFRFVHDDIPAGKYRILQTSMCHTIKPAMIKSSALMKMKYLFYGWLSKEQGKVAISNMNDVIWQMYEPGHSLPDLFVLKEQKTRLEHSLLEKEGMVKTLRQTVESAEAWQASWCRRVFRRWHPPGNESSGGFFQRLQRSITKRLNNKPATASREN